MITVYKKKAIPKNRELVIFNDVYLNKYTVEMLDERAEEIIEKIDSSKMLSRYIIRACLHKVRNVVKVSVN